MRIDIRGDKIKITEGMKTQIEEKIGHLDSYFKEPESLKAYVDKMVFLFQVNL